MIFFFYSPLFVLNFFCLRIVCAGSSSCGEQGPLARCGAQASVVAASRCGEQASVAVAPQLWSTGSVVVAHWFA